MSANERFQEDVQQTKADFSQLKSEIKGGVDVSRAKDEAAFRVAGADAKTQLAKLQAQRADLKATIVSKTGDARDVVQAELDRIDSQIALAQAAMDEYYTRRDAGEAGLI